MVLCTLAKKSGLNLDDTTAGAVTVAAVAPLSTSSKLKKTRFVLIALAVILSIWRGEIKLPKVDSQAEKIIGFGTEVCYFA